MKKIMLLLCAAAMLAVACEEEDPIHGDDNTTTSSDTTQMIAEIIPDVVVDIDGNHYSGIWIGNKLWMAENLRTTHYADSSLVGWSAPANNESYIPTYGLLYSWGTATHGHSSNNNPSGVQGICPDGWHLPSDAEWTDLENFVKIHNEYICGDCDYCIAKSLAASSGWTSSAETCTPGYNQNTNNATGFSALPAGYGKRHQAGGGGEPPYFYYSYEEFGSYAFFWSSTESVNDNTTYACSRELVYNRTGLSYGCSAEQSSSKKVDAYSVRCVRD